VAGTYNPACIPDFGTCPTGGTAVLAAPSRIHTTTPLPTRVWIQHHHSIGNKYAQSVQARSLMEYRQAELRLEQEYTLIRMQVVNAQFGLTNDRAQVWRRKQLEITTSRTGCGREETAAGASTTLRSCSSSALAAAEDSSSQPRRRMRKIGNPLPDPRDPPCSTTASISAKRQRGNVNTAPVIPGIQPAPPARSRQRLRRPLHPPTAPVAPTTTPNHIATRIIKS